MSIKINYFKLFGWQRGKKSIIDVRNSIKNLLNCYLTVSATKNYLTRICFSFIKKSCMHFRDGKIFSGQEQHSHVSHEIFCYPLSLLHITVCNPDI